MNAGEVAIPNCWYASPHLVHRGRHDRRHPGRGRNSHIRAANKPTLSPRRHYPLDTGCNSYPIRLHQTSDPFPARWIDDFCVERYSMRVSLRYSIMLHKSEEGYAVSCPALPANIGPRLSPIAERQFALLV